MGFGKTNVAAGGGDEEKLKAHLNDKDNPHEVTAEQVGLGNVPNVATDDQTPTFSVAGTLAALVSGEKLSVSMGKIAKAVSDLISHLADTTKHITAAERTAWNSKAAGSHTHPVSQITGVLPVSKGGTGQTSLAALMSAMGAGKIVAGTYTGNGNESMTINLGFKPKAVLLYVLENKLVLYGSSYSNYEYQHPRYSALGIQGNDVINAYYKWYQGTCTQEGPTYKVLSLGDNGFTVYYYSTEGGKYNYGLDCNGNFAGLKLGYVAFG